MGRSSLDPEDLELIDLDGDGRADEKKELYGTFGYADTGLWGRSPGDSTAGSAPPTADQSEIRGADGSRIQLQSGNTYRFRADGSRVEQLRTAR